MTADNRPERLAVTREVDALLRKMLGEDVQFFLLWTVPATADQIALSSVTNMTRKIVIGCLDITLERYEQGGGEQISHEDLRRGES